MTRKSKRDDGSRILPNLYGYDPDRRNWNPKAPIIKLEVDFITQIFDLFTINRLSASSIATRLNEYQTNQNPPPPSIKVFTSDFVLKILKRIEYSGRARDSNNKIIYSKHYEEIIPPATFDLAQAILTTRKQHQISGSNLKNFPLSGFLVCNLCENTRYYVKYAQNKTRSPYYYHKKRTNNNCLTLLNAETVNELLYATFTDMFTSKKALRIKYEHFFEFYQSDNQHDSNLIPKHPFARHARNKEFSDILLNDLTLVKNGAVKPEHLADRIKTAIDEVTKDRNEDLVKEFTNYIRNTIIAWYSDDTNKFDLIYQYLQSAIMISHNIHLKWIASEPYNVRIVPLSNEWSDKLAINIKNREVISAEREIKLKELTDFIKQLCKKVSSEQAKELFRIAESYEQTINTSGFLLSKSPLEHSGFVKIDRAFYPSAHKHFIYRNLENGKTFLSKAGKNTEIQPYWVSDRIFAYKKESHIYFNTSFLHSLPEWFYGYNFEYFKTGNKKICFMIDESSVFKTVKAFELKRLGNKKPIAIQEAIASISLNPNARFVDID